MVIQFPIYEYAGARYIVPARMVVDLVTGLPKYAIIQRHGEAGVNLPMVVEMEILNNAFVKVADFDMTIPDNIPPEQLEAMKAQLGL